MAVAQKSCRRNEDRAGRVDDRVRMKPVTVFSWGFWGWGTATRQLIAAVDAAEGRRGV